MDSKGQRLVSFILDDMRFEYDPKKNEVNIKKHGISFITAARVFCDYNRIELYDEDNSSIEDRYDTIGNPSVGDDAFNSDVLIGEIGGSDVIFVVYTERIKKEANGLECDVTRIISARNATSFERGLYYGKY